MSGALRAEGLAVGYPGRPPVGAGIDLEVRPGEILGLLGPNGGGKTTLLKTLLGLLRPLAGRVTLGRRDVASLARGELARSLGYVPQAHAGFFPYAVADVVLMGRAPHVPAFAVPGARDRERAGRAMAELGIGHLAARAYTEASGGERQLALIARALAQEPRILVMDEPTASLDYGNQARVLGRIRDLAARGGLGVLLSTHDPAHALLCADRAALLGGGRLLAQGPPDAVVTAAALEALYGVPVEVGRLPSGRPACAPAGIAFSPAT